MANKMPSGAKAFAKGAAHLIVKTKAPSALGSMIGKDLSRVVGKPTMKPSPGQAGHRPSNPIDKGK